VAYGTVNETFMPSWIINMNCTGEETSLEQCAKKPWGQPSRSCKPAYVLCYKKGGGVEQFNFFFQIHVSSQTYNHDNKRMFIK